MTAPTSAGRPTPVESALERSRMGGDRDEAADRRDEAADRRDEAGTRRDQVGEDRDEAAEIRDHAGDVRDDAADRRDLVADLRDDAAAERDRQADDRDRTAVLTEPVGVPGPRAGEPPRTAAALRHALARRDAAGDLEQAARDRRAGAVARTQAEADRGTSWADRRSGAVERVEAGSDRESAHGDRGSGADGRVQSADDRESASVDRGQARIDLTHASLDGLTGVYTRSAGLLEAQREVDRARRTGGQLVLAFVDVDGLKAVNDSGGHAAGDRVLVRVAEALRGRLRPYDVIVRYGGDEFLCLLTDIGPDEAAVRLRGVNAALARDDDAASTTASASASASASTTASASAGTSVSTSVSRSVSTSVSIGLSDLRPDDLLQQLVERADRDLYVGRRAARPRPPA